MKGGRRNKKRRQREREWEEGECGRVEGGSMGGRKYGRDE